MTNADDRLQRLLLAFPLMADEPRLTLDQLAARVGTDAKTLANDFACLDRDDTPAGFVDAIQLFVGDQRVSMRSAHFKRPMRLTRPELAALELGLGILQQELPVDEQHLVRGVRERLRDTAARPVDTVVDRRKAAGEPSVRAVAVEAARDDEWTAVVVLQRAMETHRVVELAYQRPDDAHPSMRRVHPYAMVRADANIYLVAYCERAVQRRVFRLDRVTEAVETEQSFARPSDFSVDAVLQQGHVFVQDAPAPEHLEVRYSATVARWIAERESGVAHPDGSFVVRYPLADEAWAVRHVLQYGPDAVIVGPERLREQLELVLQRLLAQLPDTQTA
ncbi:MAG: WYL domain-containing protein [Gemmatimonadota bacterium]|jgi:proteasome accessory factor C|nr:WYL domain-containing protein [Gemmatimonadota bacterium]